MGLFSPRKRFVVSTLFVAVEGDAVLRLFRSASEAVRAIAGAEDDFATARDALVQVAEAILADEHSVSHVANRGEVFSREEDAGAYGEECFAECAGRYLSSGDRSGGDAPAASTEVARGYLVLMLTIAYQGERKELEKTIATRNDLASALSAIVALARQDKLDLAHVHLAPGRPDENIGEEQLLVNYPELVTI